ncbi:MAG: Ig-like domain-containing protein, partial [Oscillospiraceae bacterium]|nr:Ig-like domain-containing protein [Oscillospiraceae bacterium]
PWSYTLLGDTRWLNYEVSYDFKLDMANNTSATNHVMIGVRHNRSELENNANALSTFGYKFKLQKTGAWNLYKGSTSVASGTVAGFDSSVWHNISLSAVENVFTAKLDGQVVREYTDTAAGVSTIGQVLIGTSLHQTVFDNLKVTKISGQPAYADEILDDLDSRVLYANPTTWNHPVEQGGDRFNRTLTTGTALGTGQITVNKANQTTDPTVPNKFYFGGEGAWGSYTDHWNSTNGALVSFAFQGTAFQMQGNRGSDKFTADEILVYLDDVLLTSGDPGVTIIGLNGGSGSNVSFVTLTGLPDALHTVKVVLNKTSANGLSITNAVYYNTATGANPWFQTNLVGTGFDLIGDTGAAVIDVYVDGELVSENYSVRSSTLRRTASYSLRGLDYAEHNIRVDVKSGAFALDAISTVGNLWVDKTALAAAIAAGTPIEIDPDSVGKYVAGPWNTFLTALADARIVYADDDATQAEIDEATEALLLATEALEEEEIATAPITLATPDKVTIKKGRTVKVPIEFNGNEKYLTYTSGNAAVATVAGTGTTNLTVTGVKVGNAPITVRANDGSGLVKVFLAIVTA